MKTLTLILLTLSLNAQLPDDAKHVYAGAGITMLTAEVTNQCIDRPFISTMIGFGTGILAGITKEYIYDRRMDRGVFNKWDMANTAWGAAIGALVIMVKFDLDRKRDYNLKEDLQ